MDTWILSKTRSFEPTVAIVPTAAANESPDKAARNGSRHFQEMGAQTIESMILSREDAYDKNKLSELDRADLIYFTGGNPQHLLETISGTPAESALREASGKGSILAGSSAGAMVMGSTMRYQGWTESLAFFKNLTILPHHENSSPEATLTDCSQALRKGLTILGLDGATGVFISDHQAQVVGNGAVTKYFQEGFQIFDSGDRFPL